MNSLMQLVQGSAHHLPFLADGSIHAVITSPPYFNLRRYDGDQDIDWPEVSYSPMAGLPPVTVPAQRCALGAEAEPFAYIGHLILCLREWGRVLRDDGVCLVNLGDSYANGPKSAKEQAGQRSGGSLNGRRGYADNVAAAQRRTPVMSIPPKNLLLIPARFALAAQADGWIVRSNIIWAKGVSFLPDYAGSAMPESVTDRPSRTHEDIFLLAKRERYFWDGYAVREKSLLPNDNRKARSAEGQKSLPTEQVNGIRPGSATYATRNLRSVFVINPRPFAAAHFACWPETLVDPMIRAATSERGCCPACGAPWVRVVEREKFGKAYSATKFDNTMQGGPLSGSRQAYRANGMEGPPPAITTGWSPTCTCKEYKLRDDLTPEQKDYVLLRLQEYRNRVILHRDSIADSVQSENKPNGKEMCTMRESDGIVPQCLRED